MLMRRVFPKQQRDVRILSAEPAWVRASKTVLVPRAGRLMSPLCPCQGYVWSGDSHGVHLGEVHTRGRVHTASNGPVLWGRVSPFGEGPLRSFALSSASLEDVWGGTGQLGRATKTASGDTAAAPYPCFSVFLCCCLKWEPPRQWWEPLQLQAEAALDNLGNRENRGSSLYQQLRGGSHTKKRARH